MIEQQAEIDVLLGMCVDTVCRHMDMCVGICMDVCVDMCMDMCVDMCVAICTDMFIDMCVDIRWARATETSRRGITSYRRRLSPLALDLPSAMPTQAHIDVAATINQSGINARCVTAQARRRGSMASSAARFIFLFFSCASRCGRCQVSDNEQFKNREAAGLKAKMTGGVWR